MKARTKKLLKIVGTLCVALALTLNLTGCGLLDDIVSGDGNIANRAG